VRKVIEEAMTLFHVNSLITCSYHQRVPLDRPDTSEWYSVPLLAGRLVEGETGGRTVWTSWAGGERRVKSETRLVLHPQ